MPNVPYNPTQSVTPQVGMPGDYLGVRAQGSDFGAQTGQALQNLGQEVSQASEPLQRYALARQGQLNDAAATDAETQANEAYGQELDKLKTKTGTAAASYLPEAQSNIVKVRQQIRNTLPNDAARRAFDLRIARSEGFIIREAHSYADTQTRSAITQTKTANMNMFKEQAGRPEIALNQDSWDHNFASLKLSATEAFLDAGNNGSIDPETGDVSFPDEQTKTLYTDFMRKVTGEAWENRFATLTNPLIGNAKIAKEVFEQNKDDIPSTSLSKIATQIAIPLKNLETREVADDRLTQLNKDYDDFVSSSKTPVEHQDFESVFQSIKKQEGGPKTNVMQIKDYNLWKDNALPGEFINDPVANERVGRRIIQKYYDKYGGDAGKVATAYFSGEGNVSESGPTPYKDDAYSQKINPKNPLVSEYIAHAFKDHQGKSLGVSAPYISKADYITLHRDELLNQAQDAADERFPGRPDLAYQSVTRFNQYLTGIESRQHAQDHLAIQGVYRYMNDMNQSGKPVTSEYQLDQAPDDVRHGWEIMQREDPNGTRNLISRWALENARGKSETYGSDFYSLFKDIGSGKITKLTQLGNSLDGIHLTGSGLDSLKTFLDDQATPEGKSFSKAMLAFYEKYHSVMTYNIPGTPDEKGEANFREFMQQSLPAIASKKKDHGTNMFNPEDQSYVGNGAHAFIRTETQMRQDYDAALKNLELPQVPGETKFDLSSLENVSDAKTGIQRLLEAKAAKQITAEQAKEYSNKRGWTKSAEFSVPQVYQ